MTLTTAACAASPRPGCRGRTSPRPSPRWTRRRVCPSRIGRAIAGRVGEKEESEAGPTRPRRSFTRALSFGDVDDDAVGGAVGGGSNAESPAPGIEPPTSPSEDAALADPDTAFGKGSGSLTGATSSRGETPSWGIPSKKTSFGGEAGVFAAGTPGTPDADSRVIDASAVPSDARGAFKNGQKTASRDFRANDEEVGVNVSKPLTPRPSLDVRVAPRSIDGGSRGLAGNSGSFESFDSRPRAHGRGRGHDGYLRRVHLRQGPSSRGGALERVRGGVPDAPALHAAARAVPLRVRAGKTSGARSGGPGPFPHYPHISGVGFAPNPSAPSSPPEPRRGSSASTTR